MNWSLQLITLLTCTMLGWSGEAVLTLPPTAQRHIDTLNAEITKAEEEKNQKVNRAVDKAIRALNLMVRDAKTAQERRAIDDEILRLEKLKGDPAGDLAGGAASTIRILVGEWIINHPGFNGSFVFSQDGTVSIPGKLQGSWSINEKEGVVRIDWPGNKWDEFSLPLKPTGVPFSSWASGRNSGTAVKKETK